MTPTARSLELRSLAQRIADGLPASVEEVVVTGSVSRGVAELDLVTCFSLAAAVGLGDLGTWPRRAAIVTGELQLETAMLAPDGPNIVRARRWLEDELGILMRRNGS